MQNKGTLPGGEACVDENYSPKWSTNKLYG